MSETTSPILLISGPPGAGKTTVAKLLVEAWGAPVAHIEGDAFWKFFARPAPAASPVVARRRDARILIQSMVATAARFARGGYDAICDFTVGPWALDAIVTGLKGIPLDYVVVCPSEAVCAARVAEHCDGAIEDYAPYRELHQAYGRLGELEAHAIRDDRADAGEIAAQIHAGLARGAYRLTAA